MFFLNCWGASLTSHLSKISCFVGSSTIFDCCFISFCLSSNLSFVDGNKSGSWSASGSVLNFASALSTLSSSGLTPSSALFICCFSSFLSNGGFCSTLRDEATVESGVVILYWLE